jgi:hypothetical protein
MLKIRYVFVVLGMLWYSVTASATQVSVGIGLPHVSIGINLPVFPQLVVVPGYPVYYAPRLEANYFFYDGMYWVYQDDYWYASSWYNGPWWLMGPEVIPVFILRIPVHYYRRPPAYFHGWRSDAPPRWGHHWGHDWEQRRGGWDRWDRRAAPAPAPVPVYQREYSGDRYPRQVERQQALQNQKYRYQPRDPIVRQYYQGQAVQRAPDERGSGQQNIRRSAPQDGPAGPRSQSPQRRGEDVQRPTPASPQQGRPEVQDRGRPPQPQLDQRDQQTPGWQDREEKQQGKDVTLEPKRRQGQGQGQEEEQEQGQERGRRPYE